ncbi:hypothetical protein TCSYLVIO_006498 [Trypanosoma cruzi]|nr:hypothetical protein TCSYLVIO_006498 [Trypanosoma cruzi]
MRQPQEQQRLAIFEEERNRLEMLAAQLKYAQRHCCEVVEGLGKGKEELQRQCTAHQQQLEHLQQVSLRNNTQELSRALKANEKALVQLREDLQQSFATERAQAREREKELEQRCVHQSSEVRQVTEMLALAREQLQMEVERRNQAELRVQEAEEAAAEAQRHCGVAVSDLHRDVEAEKDAMEAKLQHLQRELIARRAEAVCVRQESIALDANVTKMEFLLEHGYERAAAEQHYTLLLTREAAARAAQDELIALLEDVTREHELAKCRECLSAPMSLLETVHAEGNYHDKYEYLSDVVGHLFRSVQGLVMYAEGSLNSLESLRHGLCGVWGRHDNESDAGGQKTVNPPLPNSTLATGPFPSSLPSSTVSAAANSPMRQPQEQQRLAIFEEERNRLEMLAAQLKYAQRHCCEVVEGLGKGKEELQRQCTAHQQQLEHLQQVSLRNNTQELSRALKANEKALVQLREDLQQSFATERAQAREREKELEQRCVHQSSEVRQVTEMLALAREQLQMEVERRNQAELRVQEAEEAAAEAQRHCGVAVSDLHRDVEAEKDAMEAKLQHLQRELIARRAEAVCVRQESIALDANVTKMEFLLEHGYERAAAEQHYTLLLTREAARHAQIQIATEQRALREREATVQQCYEDLCSLLVCMREDEFKAEAQQREAEADTEARRRIVSVETHTGIIPKKKKNDECGTVEEVDDGNDDGAGGKTQVLLHRYGTPTTLTGVVACLQNAYEAVRRHQRYMQSTVDVAKERVRQLQQEVATLHPRLEQLMAEYEKQQVNFKRIWNEQTMWERQETLKGLLAKQEALLATVNVEREALQVRWSTLSEEYRALERRNSQLHERCAVKEAENARLLGFLRAKQITSPSSFSPSSSAPQRPTSTSSRSPGVVCESPAEATTNAKETAVGNSPDTRRTENSTVPRHPVSRGSSSVAGLSGQARTSCSSFLDEEAAVSNSAVGVVLPLGQHPHDRGVWRTAYRFGQGVRTTAAATATTAEEEPCKPN